MPNGYKYSNLLIKLYLKALKFEGALRLNEFIPYNLQMISAIVGMDIDTVKVAFDIYKQLKLIEILDDGTIYMLEIQNFIGKSTTEADRKRKYRAKIEAEKKKKLLESDGGQMSDKNPPEIEQEIETEIEQEIEIQQQIERIVECNPNEAKTVIKTVKAYSKDRNVVDVVKEKIKIINSGDFRNRLGALVTAIKEDWSYSESKNETNGFNNFEGRDYVSGYGGETFKSLENKLLGWNN
ncbi:phage replisome organizer, putative, N-terminal region [Clostridium sp. DSM 8431]|nr:phage replisome organizer, putative, N-terminal region [Clostridium sp. DSM 8431]